ncbi:hypothetical protein RYX36_032680 [Vicia faba]
MIRLALRDEGKWVITKVVKEHTHKLMSLSEFPRRRSEKHLVNEDEKDKRIRELSLQLYNERKKYKQCCAAYEEQLNMILNDLEKHTEHISKKVADVVRNIREIEEERSDSKSKTLWISFCYNRMLDHQSGQGFVSDGSHLDTIEEINEKHESVKDEFSNNLELCAGEAGNFVEQPVPDSDTLEPFIDMHFNSKEAITR